MAEEFKAVRPKANEDVQAVTFPSGDGTHKTVRKFPYTPKNGTEAAFFASHPMFTDRPDTTKKKKDS